MPTTETHYEILGVGTDANPDEIHHAYTALLKESQTIPDSEGLRAFMARAKMAHQVLSHAESRALYHQQMDMAEPEKRKWEVEGEPRGRDRAIASAIGTTSLLAPLVVFLLLVTGGPLLGSLVIGLLFMVPCFAATWVFVKFWIRMSDSESSVPAQK